MSSLQLYPEVIDGSTLGVKTTNPVFLPIGIEGEADSDGSAAVAQLYEITTASDAAVKFGVASNLTSLITWLLARGAAKVYAVASAKGATPLIAEREAAWQTLEANSTVRIRLTDSLVQADLVALGTSCDNANLLNNKQFAIVGMATGTAKETLLTAAGVISSKRVVLVGPGVYDENGILRDGSYLAAAYACVIAQNSDLSDSLNFAPLPYLTGMEQDALGNDLFRAIVVGGVVQNDFEDLLQGGVSPVAPDPTNSAGMAITHLRMTYHTDGSFDALMTRLIYDQLFIMVKNYVIAKMALRKGNTDKTRGQIASGVDSLLKGVSNWLQPHTLGDGTVGYGVTCTASPDNRQLIVHFEGDIVRGIDTMLVDGELSITV